MSNLVKVEHRKHGADVHVYIATPAHTIFANFHVSLLRNVLALVEAGVSVTYAHLSGHPHVDDARNLLVTDFLESRATHMLFWDADVAAEPTAVLKLIEHQLNVVGGAYPLKDGSGKFPVRGDAYDTPRGKMFRADGLPTGFLLMKRHVLERMASLADYMQMDGKEVRIVFERGYRVDESGRHERVGGDFNFINKWIEMGEYQPGGKCRTAAAYVDPSLLFTHAGVVDFAGRLSDHLNESHKGPPPSPVPIGTHKGPVPKPVPLQETEGDDAS